jgi:amidase
MLFWTHANKELQMARSVKDAAYLLHAIAGKDPYDNYTSAIPFKTIPDYVAACKFSALKGKRLGVPRNLIDLTNDATAVPIIPVFNAALKVLEAAGAIIVENTNFTGVSCPHLT